MKKTFIAFLSVAFALGFVSCQKEQTVVVPIDGDTTPAVPTEPTYQEGVYAPLLKIASIERDDDETVETWNWSGEQLTSVTSNSGTSRQFTYSNGRLSQVTGSMTNLFGVIPGIAGNVSFTYNGTLFKNCTVTSDGTDVVLATFGHADNRVSSIDIALDAEYISEMLNDMITGGMGKSIDPKQITLSEADNSIHADLTWTDKNVTAMTMSGSIPFDLTKETFQALRPYLPIDSSMLRMIDFYFMVANSIPMQIDIVDTLTYTYDNKINPFYCYMGEVTPSNLSLNNVLSSSNYGTIAISVSLGSSTTPVYTQPIDQRSVYFYQYNDRNYPILVEGSDNYTITYKQ